MTKTVKAGAIAAAATCCITLMGVQATGALAETGTTSAEIAPAPAESETEPDPLPRFYSAEVVQQIPETPASDAGSLAALVETMPADAPMSRDLMCLAQAIYFEARGEPLDGQLAVGAVIVNRTNSKHYPGDYCSVVTQPGQFSFVRRGRSPSPDDNSLAWSRAQAVAQIAHQDLWDSQAGDALFFHARYVRPGWARQKVAVATIDSHIFYR